MNDKCPKHSTGNGPCYCEMLDLLDKVSTMPLADLAKQVISGSYTPGVHNRILLERCREVDDNRIGQKDDGG